MSFLLEPYCIGEYLIDIILVSDEEDEEDTDCKHGTIVSALVPVDKVQLNVL